MGNQAATAGKVEVTGLWVYPVKSCRGIALDEARLNKYGFEHDREWMVVTEQARDNLRSFVTLRQIPRMALVVPCFEVCTTTHAMPPQMLIIWSTNAHTRVKMLLPHLLTSAHAHRVEFHVAQPCDRCMLPRVDPVLGELGKHEPTRTLTTFRTRNGKQYFGQYLLHTSYAGTRHSNSSAMG
jgi:uncharacterized protein YcbX